MKVININQSDVVNFRDLDDGQFYVLANDKKMLYQKKDSNHTLVLNNYSPIYRFGEVGIVQDECEVIRVEIEEIRYKEV